jgi:hypothetical protein
VESLRSTNILRMLMMSQAAEIGRDRDSPTHTGLRDRALLGVLADSRTTKLYDRRGQKVLLEDMEKDSLWNIMPSGEVLDRRI